ncbi:hypothetical protein GDO86_012378 [Hymenochirus boettgeri]|uniref:Protein phosphatase 1 regulatory subunit 15A n=1 Tax=Hymenochirus boettgeri TaxID=247094 RepID=A0A8T2IM19_9PIPI|nr:hypothetical protein GDO86_012378 [Hymenochirus boettgeri]
MDLYYCTHGLYPAPLLCQNKGVASLINTVKVNPEMEAIHMEIDASIVICTMAARTMKMIKGSKRFWKGIPDWVENAARMVRWTCLGVLEHIALMDCSSSGRYYCKCLTNVPAEILKQENQVEKGLHFTNQELKGLSLNNIEDQITMGKLNMETIDPLVISMVYKPSEEEDASSTIEAFVMVEDEEDSCSSENISTDSGMQDPWSPTSKMEANESNWSDDESWDSDSEMDNNKENEDIWASFCRNEDPYNPLCFSMPTKSSEKNVTDKSVKDVQTPASITGPNESDCSDEDSWDSDNEMDNSKENTLWASFCRNDPYNPLCFVMPTHSPEKPHQSKKKEHVIDLQDIDATDSVKYSMLSGDLKQRGCNTVDSTCVGSELAGVKPPLLTLDQPFADAPVESPSTPEKQISGSLKKVQFSPTVTVHPMVVWSYAYRKARKGPWEEYARDRCRFQRRIADAQTAIGFCLELQHRAKIWTRLQERNLE